MMKLERTSVVLMLVIVLCGLPNSMQECTRPSVGDNVVLTPDQESYTDWFYLAISCEGNITQTGPEYSYCDTNVGNWNPDPSLTECAPLCASPNVDESVVVTPQQTTYSSGETVSFSCENGKLEGSTTGTCGSNATWNIATSPTCLAGCAAPDYSNGTGVYDHGTSAVFSCDITYRLPTGEDTIPATCNDGSWSPDVLCEFSGCLAPEVNTNVTYSPVDTIYEVNSRVTLSCDGATTPIGPEFSYCNASGEWEPSPLLLTCYNTCQTPSFDDSRVIHTSKLTGEVGQAFYDHTDTIRFSCEGGIFVDGPWKATCKDGTWSGKIGGYRPVCKANCTAPVNTNNAGDVFQHTQRHEFQCVSTPGMVRLGGPKAFCNDGNWKPNIRCALKTDL